MSEFPIHESDLKKMISLLDIKLLIIWGITIKLLLFLSCERLMGGYTDKLSLF